MTLRIITYVLFLLIGRVSLAMHSDCSNCDDLFIKSYFQAAYDSFLQATAVEPAVIQNYLQNQEILLDERIEECSLLCFECDKQCKNFLENIIQVFDDSDTLMDVTSISIPELCKFCQTRFKKIREKYKNGTWKKEMPSQQKIAGMLKYPTQISTTVNQKKLSQIYQYLYSRYSKNFFSVEHWIKFFKLPIFSGHYRIVLVLTVAFWGGSLFYASLHKSLHRQR